LAAQSRKKWDIDHSVAVGPQLFRILRERIISGDVLPGTRLTESEIALSYSVSRQPAREAFIKLAEDGLLDVRPQRGSFVKKISVAAVMDARFIREAIEADVVKLLASEPVSGLSDVLSEQIADQKRAAARNDPAGFIELDEHFHRTLAEAAGKIHAWHVLEDLKAQMDRVRYLSVRQFPMHKLVAQHAAVADAVCSGNAEAAENRIRTHLREILTDLPEIARAMPEHFEQVPE